MTPYARTPDTSTAGASASPPVHTQTAAEA